MTTYYVLRFIEIPYEGASPYATMATIHNDQETEYHVDTSKDNPLLVFTNENDAHTASNSTTAFYNSEPNMPVNDYVGQFKVVQFQLP